MDTSLNREQILDLDKRYRIALINSLSGVRTAFIGITGEHEQWNATTLSNITHVGAYPAQLSVLFRPPSTNSHTLENYRNFGIMTLICMPFHKCDTVHEVSVNAPKDVFELELLDEPVQNFEGWGHPIPKDFIYAIEIEYVEEFTLNNQCIYTVGSINQLRWSEKLQINEQGQVFFQESPVLAIGLQHYTSIHTEGKQLPYPKKDNYHFE
jgi:hypothetical protein